MIYMSMLWRNRRGMIIATVWLIWTGTRVQCLIIAFGEEYLWLVYQAVLKCVYNVRGASNNAFKPRPGTEAAKRAFNYRGAVMWNGLENVLKDEINRNSFKSALSLP